MKTESDQLELRSYLSRFTEEQREYFPIPFLLAKENSYGNLKQERKKISNTHYSTSDFETFEFYKNIGTYIPHSELEKIPKKDVY